MQEQSIDNEIKKKISIIVPCYNEQAVIEILYKALEDVSKELSNYNIEYLFVDDGSKDKTLEILKNIAKNDSKVKYFSFSRNFGKEAAILAGFKHASGDYIATMDSDMQDPPSLLPKMVEILENEDYDSVATRRSNRKGEPKLRSFFAHKFYKIINKVSDSDIVDGARDFRLMKKQMVQVIITMKEHDRFSKGIFGWIGFKTYWLDYKNVARAAGNTKWSFWKLFKYSITGISDFSVVPLYLPFLGFVLSMFSSIALLVWAIIEKCVRNIPMQNFKLMVCIMVFLFGLVFLSIGIMGIYIAKINYETKNRPHYIISQSNESEIEK